MFFLIYNQYYAHVLLVTCATVKRFNQNTLYS